MFFVIYLLARIAMLDLSPPANRAVTPADGLAERGQIASLAVDSGGAAEFYHGNSHVRLGGHVVSVEQAFLLVGGDEALTVAGDGSARITRLDAARLLNALDAPLLFGFMRSHLWRPYGAAFARGALFAAEQVLPLEIPERAKGWRSHAYRDCATCPQMVVIAPGVFLMGSSAIETKFLGPESPRRAVTIEHSLAVGQFAVTFDEWDACVDDRGCNGYRPSDQGWGRGRRPVINVSFSDAKAYIAWLSNKTKRTYRLLSEAEFEFVARAGAKTTYPWGDSIGRNNANCSDCGSDWDNKEAAPVGSFNPNEFGLYDLAGNVWEWTEDCYTDNYNGAPSDGSAWTEGDCGYRVIRGGSWATNKQSIRSASRAKSAGGAKQPNLGFRIARSL
jgi:formylglycine-generating enzyme required for sulfatase activity